MTQHLPGPWVDPEPIEPKPWLHDDGIVKFMEFPIRHPSMSRRAFHLYWQRHHSPNVMNVTAFSQFMRKYTTAHVLPETFALPPRYLQTTTFEGVSEVWINRVDEIGAWLGHPLYAELIRPDESRFIHQEGGGELVVVKEERLYDPERDLIESGLTKVYVLMKRRPADFDHDAFHAALSECGHRLIDMGALRKTLRKFVISHRLRDPRPGGLVLSDIDAVSEMWFDKSDDVVRFYSDCADLLRKNSGAAPLIDSAELRVLVAKVHVVHDEFSYQPSTMQPLPFNWRD
jgi:hypothetical protein